MKLLIAEDTRDLNRAISAVLMRENYAVDSVFDGAEALEKLRSERYDGIILDIMMPKMSGLEVLQDPEDQHRDPGSSPDGEGRSG